MKTRMKQFISLLCALSLIATSVLVPDLFSKDVQASGSQEQEALPTGLTEISFRDFGFADGTYSKSMPEGQYGGATMDGTLFSGKITFSEAGEIHLMYGGKTSWGGLDFATARDTSTGEYYLRLFDTNYDKSGAKFKERKFTSDVAGVQLVGKELDLKLSMQYVNVDDGETNNDLKLGVWFGGKLYNNEYIYINDYVDAGHCVGNWMTLWIRNDATVTMKSSDIEVPAGLTEISFSDFGLAEGLYNKSTKSGKYSGETMDGTLFHGRITFSEAGETHFMYGGKEAWGGFDLATAKDATTGEHYLRLFDSNLDKSGAKFKELKFTSDVAGVQLVGKELDLKFSMQYVNVDNGETNNDLKLGVWFGGKLYNNEYIYINNYVDAGHCVGNWMTLWIRDEASVTLKSVHTEVPASLQKITFSDFGFADGTYGKSTKSGEYEGETLNGTLFSGKITFSESGEAYLMYGGKEAWGGFDLATAVDTATGEYYLRLFDSNQDKSGKKFNDKKLTSDIAGTQLVGKELDLKLSLEYVNIDGGETADDLKLGVWFNGKLYNDEYIYINNYVNTGHSIGNWMTLWIREDATLTLKSEEKYIEEQLPEGLTEISFRDFGFIDGVYGKSTLTGEYDGWTMENTLFSGLVTFSEAGEIHLMYGGKLSWGGFDLATAKDEATGEYYLRLFDSNQDKSGKKFNDRKFTSDVAGVQLVGKELDLKFSLEYINNDNGETSNDLKLGVWFGGKLYNNEYIYINNYVDTGHSIGNWMTIWIRDNATVMLQSVGEADWEELPEGLTEISFRDFGFIDGTYGKATMVGKYDGTTMDGTLFSGKITFSEAGEIHLMYGGKLSWGGFDLATAKDEATGEYYLRLFDSNQDKSGKKFNDYAFHSDVAGVQLVGKELDLKFSIEYVDNDGGGVKNDLKLGVWFGGRLYNNSYIYINNYVDTGHSIGNWMTIWIRDNATATLQSVGEIKWEELPKGLTEISFRDFGFVDGTYGKATMTGEYIEGTLNGTLFSGKITFSESGEIHLMYGGKQSWGGFDLATAKNETTGEHYLRLFDTNQDKSGKKFNDYAFHSNVAGVQLVGKELDLKFSMEYIDNDGGGAKNDLKLGVWFGGRLYNNSYIYINNYVDTGHSIGNWMTIWIRDNATATLQSVGEINWKEIPKGLTEIGFDDFGIVPGVYEQGAKVGQRGISNMENTLFSAIVTFSEVGETHLMYGGKKSYSGFDLMTIKDATTGEYYLRLYDTNADKTGKMFSDYKFYSNVAGVQLVGAELDLKLSMEYVDNDGGGTRNDLKLGVWFGGKLYNNRYIYIDNYVNTSHSIGNYMTLWVRNGATFHVGRISDWLDWAAFGLTENWEKILLDTDFNLDYALNGRNPYTGDITRYSYLVIGNVMAAIVLCGYQWGRKRRTKYDI